MAQKEVVGLFISELDSFSKSLVRTLKIILIMETDYDQLILKFSFIVPPLIARQFSVLTVGPGVTLFIMNI